MKRLSCVHGEWNDLTGHNGYCMICYPDGYPPRRATAKDNDPVNPDHYKVGGIETIEFIEAKLSPEEFAGYCKGNMLKYITRAGHKDDAGQDMRKALWYGERWLRARDARS